MQLPEFPITLIPSPHMHMVVIRDTRLEPIAQKPSFTFSQLPFAASRDEGWNPCLRVRFVCCAMVEVHAFAQLHLID